MTVIVIVSAISVVGAVAAVLLTHRIVGFRKLGQEARVHSRPVLLEGDPFETNAGLDEHLHAVYAEVRRLNEQISERELIDAVRWRILAESKVEVARLEELIRQTRFEMDERLRNAESERRKDDLELTRERELEIEHSRLLDQREQARLGTLAGD